MNKNKNPYDMHYKHRKDTDTIEVSREPNKFKLYFNGAKSAKHVKDHYISVITNLGLNVSVDEHGIKHYR